MSKVEGLDFFEAMDTLSKGNVIKYIGTARGDIPAKNGTKFAMFRCCVWSCDRTGNWSIEGGLLYDLDFRYQQTGETVDTNRWPTESPQS